MGGFPKELKRKLAVIKDLENNAAVQANAAAGSGYTLFKKGAEGETFIGLYHLYPGDVQEAAKKYGSVRAFITAVLNGETFISSGNRKFTLIPDASEVSKVLTIASGVLGAIGTFVPIVAPIALPAGAAMGVAAKVAGNADRKLIEGLPEQQKIVAELLLDKLPGDVFFENPSVPPGVYIDASTGEYQYTVDDYGKAIYQANDVRNYTDYVSEKLEQSLIYLDSNGKFNSRKSQFTQDVAMGFDLTKFLDTAGKVVSTATGIYQNVANATSGSSINMPSVATPVVQPSGSSGTTGTNTVYVPAGELTSSSGSSNTKLIMFGGFGILLILIVVLLNKK